MRKTTHYRVSIEEKILRKIANKKFKPKFVDESIKKSIMQLLKGGDKI